MTSQVATKRLVRLVLLGLYMGTERQSRSYCYSPEFGEVAKERRPRDLGHLHLQSAGLRCYIHVNILDCEISASCPREPRYQSVLLTRAVTWNPAVLPFAHLLSLPY